MQEYLRATKFIDYEHDLISAFVAQIQPKSNLKELAIDLYYLVRDAFIYDPYHLNISENGLKASQVVGKKRAWCVEKATLLATVARKFGIPSRLGYAIVKNHIGVDKLIEYLRKEEIVFHGYTELFIDGKWVKCTPAFDKRICAISGVSPLEWNGEEDSLFQAYEGDQQFMEYLFDYGVFADVPIELMNTEMKKHYPHLFENQYESKTFSFKHNL